MSETSRKRLSLGRITLVVVGGAAVVGLVRYGLFDYSHTHETSLIVEDGQVVQTVKGGGWYYRLPGDSREIVRSIADALETGNGVIRHVLATSWDGHLPDVTSGKTEIVRQLVAGEAGAARAAGPLASKANRAGNGGGAAGE